MRRMTFDRKNDTDARRFATVYSAFVLGGGNIPQKGIEGLDLDANLMEKFKQISFRPPDLPLEVRGIRTLNAGVQELTITEEEHATLIRYFGAMSWNPEHAVEVRETLRWFREIPPQQEG